MTPQQELDKCVDDYNQGLRKMRRNAVRVGELLSQHPDLKLDRWALMLRAGDARDVFGKLHDRLREYLGLAQKGAA